MYICLYVLYIRTNVKISHTVMLTIHIRMYVFTYCMSTYAMLDAWYYIFGAVLPQLCDMCFVRILQELYAVLCDATGYRMDEDHTPVLSCVDLAAILKQWVQKRHNTKVRDVS